MYDRQTRTLWENLSGRAVVGSLAAKNAQLQILPMTLTTWGEWRRMHEETKVLRLDPEYGARWGYRYEPGLADKAREGVSFPVWKKSKLLEPETEVYAVRIGDRVKAYVIDRLMKQGVVNDRIGDVNLVLIADSQSGAVRVYRRGNRFFSKTGAELKDEAGQVWDVTEEALVGGEHLERLAGHLVLWFAWFGFYPQTEIFK